MTLESQTSLARRLLSTVLLVVCSGTGTIQAQANDGTLSGILTDQLGGVGRSSGHDHAHHLQHVLGDRHRRAGAFRARRIGYLSCAS
jgi:hypothetical protein